MGKQRGSKAQAMTSILLALLGLMLLNSKPIESAKYFVGGKNGWNADVNTWPNGKVFHANDVLVFKYVKGDHNVVRVNKHGYETCLPNENSKTYNSGHDQIKLRRGTNYFICTLPGHCQAAGMRIAIKAV